MLNRGVNGEETEQMMARFATGVIAAHPDLVLWQVGTNSVLRDHPLKPHSVLLHEGIEQLKDAGADVVLIDLQFAPRVLAKPETQGMEDQIALAAKDESVDLFRRFALMRNWHEVQHIPFDAFVAPDELHMNDWSYACVAKLLAAGDRRGGDPSDRFRRGPLGTLNSFAIVIPPAGAGKGRGRVTLSDRSRSHRFRARRARPRRCRRDVRGRRTGAPGRR